MIERFALQHVDYMPPVLLPGVLYVSFKYGTAAHLCACGCGVKIRTPLAPTEWELTESAAGPSLFPSVGNWQRACRSHYWIEDGAVRWSRSWSEAEVEKGRQDESQRRKEYFDTDSQKTDTKQAPRPVTTSWWERWFRH